jgi:hypothetical protein
MCVKIKYGTRYTTNTTITTTTNNNNTAIITTTAAAATSRTASYAILRWSIYHRRLPNTLK